MTQPFATVLDALDHWAEHDPALTAFAFLDGGGEISAQLSFADLRRLARTFAGGLHETTKAGERVALIMPTSPEFVVAFFGCLYAGVLPVPLSAPTRHNGVAHLGAILKNCAARAIYTHRGYFEKINAAENKLRPPVHCFELSRLTGEPIAERVRCRPETLAFLQYTSGSTALPKGVTVSHGNIVANLTMIHEVFGHSRRTRQLNWMPLYHDMGLMGHILNPVYHGFSGYLMDPFVFVQRPRLWLEAISRYRITSTGGPNFSYQHCVKRIKAESIASLDLTCLEVAYNGAEPVKPEVMQAFYALCAPVGLRMEALLPCFGLAEASLLVSGIRHADAPVIREISQSALSLGRAESAHNRSDRHAIASMGRPAPGQTVLIIDPETLQSQAPFAIGEIWASGANITVGYWQNPEATAETFVWHLGRRYLRTGDLGFVDENGHLYITGRLKDVIIIDGKNHYPQDIETTVENVDPLLRAGGGAAFTVTADAGDERLIVVHELDRTYRRCDAAFLRELKSLVKAEISLQHALPTADIVFVSPNTIPKTTSGKVRRRLVRQRYLSGELNRIDELLSPTPIDSVASH